MPNHQELIDLLLQNRGILPEKREKFLNPKYEDLYDPYLLKDMEKAVVRIFEAIEAKEKVMIYSDYDCDGIPSAVILQDFFNKIKFNNFKVYIPHRHDEGYGLHKEAILEFIDKKIDLLITLDLGITDTEEIALAKTNNIDVIIVDHHLPRRSFNEGGFTQNELPPAVAIINPKQDSCHYPDKMLCGAGLTFKLVQGLIIKYGEYWKISKGWEKWLLDMVGIGTLSDQVPLLDENRILAFYGLKVLRKTRRPGLIEIFLKSKINISKLNEEDITFSLAPKINAASRMDDPIHAFELLSTRDLKRAKALADHLIKINDERKNLVAQIMKEVKKVLAKRLKENDKKIIVIGNPKWRIGVLGIVASKIVDEYKKPAFVWGLEGGEIIKGSCRSCNGINLVQIMNSLPENSLIEFGGHCEAGGFSVDHEEIHFLEERIISVIDNVEKIKLEKENLKTEMVLSLNDINDENYKVIEKLAPYGSGNPKPIFLFKSIEIDKIKEFGKDKNHLELSFLNSKNQKIKAIAFFKIGEDFKIKEKDKINLIANFEKNNFNGNSELRLRIIDII